MAKAVVDKVRDTVSEVKIPVRLSLKSMIMIAYVDASFSSEQDDKSISGMYVGISSSEKLKATLNGDYSDLTPLLWFTSTTRKVVRSTLLAETYAASDKGYMVGNDLRIDSIWGCPCSCWRE